MANVTVPQLKEQARDLGIKGYSKMLKPELVAAIAAAKLDAIAQAPVKPAESVTREVSMPTEAERKAERRTASLIAGDKGKRTAPMPNDKRGNVYFAQNGTDNKPFTPAQSRRSRKKGNKLKGFKGCTLNDFRQMRRALKKGTPVKAS